MVTTASPCLICYDLVSDEDTISAAIPVTEQDFTVFTLRYFLQLDKRWIDKYWTEDEQRYVEIRLCDTCRKGVEQAKAIYDELVEMAKKFREKQREAVDKIRASSDDHLLITSPSRRKSRRHQVGNRNVTEVLRQMVLEDEHENFQGPLLIEDGKSFDVEFSDVDDVAVKKEEVESADESNQSDAEEIDTLLNLLSNPAPQMESEIHDQGASEGGEVDMGMGLTKRDSSALSESGNADNDEEWSGAEEMKELQLREEERASGDSPPPSKKTSPRKRKRTKCRKRLTNSLDVESKKPRRLAKRRKQHEEPLEVDESLRCQTCGKVWKNIRSLHLHMAHTHGVRFKKHHNMNVPCPDPTCDKTFYRKENADDHFASFHAKEIRFHCDVCGKGFYIERRLLYHQRTKHGIGNTPVICELCGKSFSNRDYLYCHRYEIHGKGKKKYSPKQELKPAPEICDLCGKIFASRHTLQTHQASVHNIDVKFRCHVCEQPLANQIFLKIHLYSKHQIGERPPEMDKHQGNLKYQCQVKGCKVRYSKPEVLDKHVREVHGESGTEMPFKCRFCGKGFSIKFKFEHHEMTHSNKETRPFKCGICDKGFTNPHNLRYHELYTHKLEKKIHKRKPETDANSGQSENGD